MVYARPVVLELTVYGSYFATFQTAFQQAASGLRGVEDLEQLRLTVCVRRESVDKDIPQLLLQGIDAIRLLPKLRALALQIDCEIPYSWRRVRRNENPTPRVEGSSPPPALSFIAFDRRKFCRTLFSLAPTLQTVGLSMDGMPRGMSRIDEQVQRTEVINM
ncbi:hypothetical protein C8Q74DRAFT_1446539 [Fomes fomentarius]|nr:hypothetical protein C8Q74DRAFT_1446539 [Fomes fomentarius]